MVISTALAADIEVAADPVLTGLPDIAVCPAAVI
jgi:hypothetical protein